ncbi:TRAF-like [Arabidopsis thaliana x Arabidopsis arenosa]|uniref:TRAF-like n=1 Tax=Arabidopsis thaliana x Arabidopsis arenosa TaxID=1240361 RepID=A0A8T2BLW8_9BRAS|nr:TRAF-like [Arabidopsis thaliana x Arabidopsis arenosa]
MHSWDEVDLIMFVFDRPLIFSMDLGKKKMFFFQEKKDGDLIVVQAFKGSEGVSVTVSCIAPMASEVRNLSCSLAKLTQYTTLRQGMMVKKIQKVSEEMEYEDGFMFIPSYMEDANLHRQCSESEYIHI